MIGLDTSVVIRLLTNDPPHLAAIAQQCVREAQQRGDRLVITDVVVTEAYFALQQYGISKEDARALLEHMLSSGVVQLDPPACVPALAATAGAGLVDRLIVERYRAAGATVWTFDQRQAALTGVTRLG